MKELEYYKRTNKNLNKLKYEFDKRGINNNLIKEIPELLYRYNSLSEYVINDLKNDQVSLTNPFNFNDLFDSYFSTYSESKVIKNYEEICSLARSLNDEYPLSLKEYKRLNKDHAKAYQSFARKHLLIKSFTEDSISSTMWSYYAAENKGICIEYNTSNKGIFNYLFPVIYGNKNLDNIIDLDDKLTDENIINAMIMAAIYKRENWKHENEWRLILPNITSIYSHNEESYYQPIVVGRASKVILGYNFFNEVELVKHEFQNKVLELLKVLENRTIPTKVIVVENGDIQEKNVDLTIIRKIVEAYCTKCISYDQLIEKIYNDDKFLY